MTNEKIRTPQQKSRTSDPLSSPLRRRLAYEVLFYVPPATTIYQTRFCGRTVLFNNVPSHCLLPSIHDPVSSNSYLSPLSLPSKLSPSIPRTPARQTSQIETPSSCLLILSFLDIYLTRYTTRPGHHTSIA